MRQKSAHNRDKLLFIVGPTAIGKSKIAFEAAKRLDAEIISCDSMQIYRNMGIMSQVPSLKWRKRIPHYLVEVLNPSEEYNVAKFREAALRHISCITEKGKTPMIVGGSGLYMKALLDGLFPSPGRDLWLRESLFKEEERKGPGTLYAKLSRVDHKAASKIHPNDTRRIVRALEVYYLTGISITEHKKMTKPLSSEYDAKIFGLIRPREALYQRINKRGEEMFNKGLVKEVKRISKKTLSMTAAASLGYKEILGYLKGKYSLEEAKELLKQNTRRFAKRQLTWFRADKRIEWVDVDEIGSEEVVEAIAKSLN